MQNIQEVSLGFAEFVSQLIQETFDAVLSSQNYQLERYAELQARLDLPNETYRKAYDIDDRLADRIQQYFGAEVDIQRPAPQTLIDFFAENFDNTTGFIHPNGRPSNRGIAAVEEFFADLIISEEKNMLAALINGSSVNKLVVDSGEITAKLEISSMFASDDPNAGSGTGTNNPNGGTGSGSGKKSGDNPPAKRVGDSPIFIKDPDVKIPDIKVPDIKDPNIKVPDPDKPDEQPEDIKAAAPPRPGFSRELLLPSYNRNVKVFQFQNNVTGRNTLLIDRKQFSQLDTNVLIPNVRLSAQPTKLTTNSNLYSEIKISFKTVWRLHLLKS